MDSEVSLLSVLLSTDFAGEWFFSGVCHQMSLHCCHTNKLLTTNPTNGNHFGRTFSVTIFGSFVNVGKTAAIFNESIRYFVFIGADGAAKGVRFLLTGLDGLLGHSEGVGGRGGPRGEGGRWPHGGGWAWSSSSVVLLMR